MWNTPPRGNVFTRGWATVPSGEPGSWDKNKLRERERSQLCVRGGLTEGEDLEGRLAGGGLYGGVLGRRNFPVS
jgi:hypothetical protein